MPLGCIVRLFERPRTEFLVHLIIATLEEERPWRKKLADASSSS
jgi:hypothetical protein